MKEIFLNCTEYTHTYCKQDSYTCSYITVYCFTNVSKLPLTFDLLKWSQLRQSYLGLNFPLVSGLSEA